MRCRWYAFTRGEGRRVADHRIGFERHAQQADARGLAPAWKSCRRSGCTPCTVSRWPTRTLSHNRIGSNRMHTLPQRSRRTPPSRARWGGAPSCCLPVADAHRAPSGLKTPAGLFVAFFGQPPRDRPAGGSHAADGSRSTSPTPSHIPCVPVAGAEAVVRPGFSFGAHRPNGPRVSPRRAPGARPLDRTPW
jgi:hypothetical protein